MINANGVPHELRTFDQWVCWRFELEEGGGKAKKVPYAPVGKHKIDPTSLRGCVSFDVALSALNDTANEFSGIGFLLHDTDPFAFIDLDDCKGDPEYTRIQEKIFKEVDSYSEISPSGTGLHILIKGDLPTGKRRGPIEIYSRDRYMTVTGNVYKNAPIQPRQGLLDTLYNEMVGVGKSTTFDPNAAETQSDSDVITAALNAENGSKVYDLANGDWEQHYSSQSEADFALINIISYYTQNRQQITRLFRDSALGKREKAQRNRYVNGMIDRSFDRLLPPINIDALKLRADAEIAKIKAVETQPEKAKPVGNLEAARAAFEAVQAARRAQAVQAVEHTARAVAPSPAPAVSPGEGVYRSPPGLLGELVQFFLDISPRPVQEIALAGAIGLMAGICGRAYNVSGTGLNQYLILVAKTGRGKEAIAKGVSKIAACLEYQIPDFSRFLGPAEIASGQALLNYLAKMSPCFLSIAGEFGVRLTQISDDRASSAEKTLYRVLLDLYNKTGKNDQLRSSAYSDTDKNTDGIRAPAFTLIGETSPELFYEAVDEKLINAGLIPRFTIIDYEGIRVPLNESHNEAEPSMGLLERFGGLVTNALTLERGDSTIDVSFSPDALQFIRKIGAYADDMVNRNENPAIAELWNRCQIKTMKLAALVAVGQNQYVPSIDLESAKWAFGIIEHDIKKMSTRFTAGNIGKSTSENKQVELIIKIVSEYFLKPWGELKSYCPKDKQLLHTQRVVPHSYLQKKALSAAPFRTDRRGAATALKQTISSMIDAGDIVEANRAEINNNFGFRGKCYLVHNLAMIHGIEE